MATMRRRATPALTLATVRASLGEMQRQGERMLARVRRDAEGFMTRSRGEVIKEVRELERRVLKVLHGATKERVTRLERRIASLEEALAEVRRPAA